MGSSYGYDLAVRLCVSAASLPLEKQTCRGCQLRRLVDVMIPWPPEAVLAVAFAGRQRLNALTPHFLDPSLSSPLPFQHVPAPAGKAVSAGRSTGTACGLSSVCLISVIDDSRTSMSKLTVLKCGQRCRQLCLEHVITLV